MKALELNNREVTEELLTEYLKISEEVKALEKTKELYKKTILLAYPKGGTIGEHTITVKEENGRRSFKFDDAQASVDETTYNKVYAPFIKLGETVRKLIITK